MLSDFLLLEDYYEGPETALFYEDLFYRYGEAPVRQALKAGQICTRFICCGNGRGRFVFSLTEKGRREARAS